jgi:LssY C-terminus
MRRPPSYDAAEANKLFRVLDLAFFVYAAVVTAWLAWLLLKLGVHPGWPVVFLVFFWILFTYLFLPRVHRILTKLYTPGYFIGRARTSDGLLADPINTAVLGAETQIHVAMTAGGWTRADDLTVAAGGKIVASTVSRRSYPEAPVSPLHLFDRQQDFAYEREVAGSPSKRHHIRFWRCPDGWMLPGGYSVDWLAAGTYDRTVGLSWFTLQITHKIAEDTDVERDFVVASMMDANPVITVEVIENFSTGYHSRNGGGDRIETDGALPIVDLRDVVAPDAPTRLHNDSRGRLPMPTLFGALVSFARAALYILIATLLLSEDYLREFAGRFGGRHLSPDDLQTLSNQTAAVLMVSAVIDIGLGAAVLAARNWARIVLMGSCALSASTAFVENIRGNDPMRLADLLPTAGSVLVLLALSSHRARDYALWRRRSISSPPPADDAPPTVSMASRTVP